MKGLGSSLIAAMALAIAWHTPAPAQVIISGDFYEETKEVGCEPDDLCKMYFSAVPEGILFSRISCEVIYKAPLIGIRLGVHKWDDHGPRRREDFLPLPSAIFDTETNFYTYSFVASLDFPVGKGRFLVIYVSDGKNKNFEGGIECKITGRMLRPGPVGDNR